MPATYHNRIERAYGPDCVFAVVNWKHFLSHLDDNHAIVTGTLEEVETPYGVGLRVARANSYLAINWDGFAPILNAEHTIFCRFFLPSIAGQYGLISWGIAGGHDARFISSASGTFRGGFAGDTDQGGSHLANNWNTIANVNQGVNGGDNIIYGKGVPVANGTNGVNSTTYSTLYLFTYINVSYHAIIGTILQEVIIFNTVRPAADILYLHNKGIGAT